MFGARRLLQGVLVVVALWVFLTPTALAQEDVSITPEDITGVNTTVDEMAEYHSAVQDCSSPSLECLVRNVNRFTAIEWSGDISGSPPCIYYGTCEDGAFLNQPTNLAQRGALGGLESLIVSMYAQPIANTKTYVAYVLDSANLAQPAQAQGLGFAALNPILNLWKTFRNLAYMFFVVTFIVIGFLIMLRQKVGQAAVTAQQAIPQIIISLLLVTFSYAIAAFLIDIMYVSLYLIIGLFSSVFRGDNPIDMNILELVGTLFGRVIEDGYNYDFISQFLNSVNITNQTNRILSTIGALTLTLVLAVAMLIGMIRIFFELLKSYATIVLTVVVSPLLLMIGAIPGKSAVFSTWIRTLIGNLVVWPTVLIVIVMYYAFVGGAVDSDGGGFMPPFLLNPDVGIGSTIVGLMGLAILLALPDIVKSIKGSIAPKSGFADMIVKSGWDSAKKVPRYSVIPASAAGAGIGLAKGVTAVAQNSGWKDPRTSAGLIRDYVKITAANSAGYAGGVARGWEQIIENKALDPNSWENTLVRNAASQKKAQRKQEKDELKTRLKKGGVNAQNHPAAAPLSSSGQTTT